MKKQDVVTGIAAAVKKVGTQAKLATKLGVSQQAISQWVDQGWAPLRRASQIGELLNIPCSELADPRILALVGAATNPSTPTESQP